MVLLQAAWNFRSFAIVKSKVPALGQTPSVPPAPSFLPSDESNDENEEGAPMSNKKATSTKNKTDNNKSSKKSGSKKVDAGIPKYLRDLPKQFPDLPPRHTFLRSAVRYPRSWLAYCYLCFYRHLRHQRARWPHLHPNMQMLRHSTSRYVSSCIEHTPLCTSPL